MAAGWALDSVYLLVLAESIGLQESTGLISPRLTGPEWFNAHSELKLDRPKLVGIFHFVHFGTRWRWIWISFPGKWLKSEVLIRCERGS